MKTIRIEKYADLEASKVQYKDGESVFVSALTMDETAPYRIIYSIRAVKAEMENNRPRRSGGFVLQLAGTEAMEENFCLYLCPDEKTAKNIYNELLLAYRTELADKMKQIQSAYKKIEPYWFPDVSIISGRLEALCGSYRVAVDCVINKETKEVFSIGDMSPFRIKESFIGQIYAGNEIKGAFVFPKCVNTEADDAKTDFWYEEN